MEKKEKKTFKIQKAYQIQALSFSPLSSDKSKVTSPAGEMPPLDEEKAPFCFGLFCVLVFFVVVFCVSFSLLLLLCFVCFMFFFWLFCFCCLVFLFVVFRFCGAVA